MEKEPQPESMATVTIKPEYTPSEYSASEPPPAYMKMKSTSVQITKIIAVTVVLCSVIMGGFLLASAYVSANVSCRQLEQELEILSEAADKFQSPPQPEALIQDPPTASTNSKRQIEPLNVEEPSSSTKELTNHIDDDSSSSESDSSESEEIPVKEPKHQRVPVQMDIDDLISHLIEKNQKSKMNCVVEKKKAEEFVDHQPKTVRLPFGINLTTNPRFEKLTGERMVIICESGSIQNVDPPMKQREEKEEEEPEDDDDEETIMIQPVMIPIPQSPFNTHMPQQMAPMPQRQEQMRPMGVPFIHIENLRPPMPAIVQQQQQQQQHQAQMPLRPPMPPQIQIHVQPENHQQQQQQAADFPPNPILQHIVQQIVAQKIMESQKLREQHLREQQMREQQMREQQIREQQEQRDSRPQPTPEVMGDHPRFMQIEQMGHPFGGQRLPIPEEVLTQLNRLPNRDVIVAVSEPDSEESPQDVQYVQEQRQSANEMNGRQTYTRQLPITIPLAMATPEHESQEQEQQTAEIRPHATA